MDVTSLGTYALLLSLPWGVAFIVSGYLTRPAALGALATAASSIAIMDFARLDGRRPSRRGRLECRVTRSCLAHHASVARQQGHQTRLLGSAPAALRTTAHHARCCGTDIRGPRLGAPAPANSISR